jgi:protease I
MASVRTLLVVFLLFGGVTVQAHNKKVVIIIASDNFRDEEFSNTKKALQEHGVDTTVASSKLSESHGARGLIKVKPDMLVSKININDYDGIAFIGGIGAEEYFNDPTTHKLATDAYAKGKIVSAICIAPVILANAGLLKGKQFNVWPSEVKTVEAKGGIFNSKSVVIDGNIITAKDVDASLEFGTKIAERLMSKAN